MFDWERANCYSLVRDFYRKTYEIELADYACPHQWWDHGLDLYRILAPQEGFHLVSDHPASWEPGDVIVMAIQSTVGNHVGVLLPTGKILHHLVGCLSRTTQYNGLFRNTTVAVYRHPQVRDKSTGTERTDILEVLSPYARRRIQERLAHPGG